MALLALAGIGWMLDEGAAHALATGIPILFTIDPATIRQRSEPHSQATALVTLQAPAPTFFICEIRSADPAGITFPSIIFKKGALRGESRGIVNWNAVLKDSRIRITAFSTDAPDRQLAFTVALKVRQTDESATPTPP